MTKNNEKEGRTLFEHLGLQNKGTSETIKKVKKVGVLLLIGGFGGFLIDLFLETDKFVIAIPIMLVIVILFKIYKH